MQRFTTMIFLNKKKNKIPVTDVSTMASNDPLRQDKNKDGIPDYLQRENYASIINSNKEYLKWDSDVEQEIEQYIMGLKGYDFDVNKNLWIPTSPPIMNTCGINFIKTYLRAIINKHSINTFLSSDEVHIICFYHTEGLIKTLKYRKNIYDIHLADLNSIIMGFDNLSYIILSRSIEDKQRQHNDNRLNMSYNSSNNNSNAGGI